MITTENIYYGVMIGINAWALKKLVDMGQSMAVIETKLASLPCSDCPKPPAKVRRFPFWKKAAAVKIFTALLLATLSAGCHLLPATRTSQNAAATQQTHAEQFTKQTENASPPITVTQSGTSNVVTVAVMPQKSSVVAAENANLAENYSDAASVTLPMGVKLILFALGLALVFAVIVGIVLFLKRNSAAVAAAFAAADNGFAHVISVVESKLRTSTDANLNAHLADVQSVLEKQRGKVNSA